MDAPALKFLEFDCSEDADGHGTFDAMAAVAPAQLPALQAELAAVLDWAHREFPGARAPLDEGGEWDYELHALQEVPTALDVRFDERAARIELRPGAPGPARITLSLTLSGTPAFGEALRARFGLG